MPSEPVSSHILIPAGASADSPVVAEILNVGGRRGSRTGENSLSWSLRLSKATEFGDGAGGRGVDVIGERFLRQPTVNQEDYIPL